MFEKITSPPKKAVAHVKRFRGRYAATAGFVTGAVVMRKVDGNTLREALTFIEEKGLSDEFYAIPAEI